VKNGQLAKFISDACHEDSNIIIESPAVHSAVGDPCRSMQIYFLDTMGYTFGDNQQASRRLHRLAEVYESETRDLLNAVRSEFCGGGFELALDLGCGPGWSTRLIKEA
jgi:hypothetical protein